MNALVSKTNPKEHREMSNQEKLTEEERGKLDGDPLVVAKALRIIDAQAAALDRVRVARKDHQRKYMNTPALLAAVDGALAGAPAPEAKLHESREEALKTAFQEYVKLVGYADWSTFKAGFIADAFKVTTAERTLREDYQRAAETAVALRTDIAAANAADQAVLEYAEQLDIGGHDGIADRLREILGATRRGPK